MTARMLTVFEETRYRAMRVKKISLRNYRNYEKLDLEIGQDIVVFTGENAQGKTNLIESVYYAALGQSHRTTSDKELISWEKQRAGIDLIFERLAVENKLQFRLYFDKKREILYNGQAIRPKELVGILNVVLFSPEDLYLIKGAPAERRRFLDVEISQANPAYYDALLQYQKALTQRNVLLKSIRERRAKRDLLCEWNAQLAQLAAKIISKRCETVKKLNMLANLMHRRISDQRENLEIYYEVRECAEGVPQAYSTWYNNKLKDFEDMDILRGNTSVGPHRDDLLLKVNSIPLRAFGSQGQQRTAALALKLAELEFMRSETGEYPILLLDDVMSELDRSRRDQLLRFIKGKVQTFVTATDMAYFPRRELSRFYQVSGGQIME